MNLFKTIFADNQLDDLDKQIETLIKSVPVKDYDEDTSDENASDLIHQFLSVEDKFADKEKLKNNVFFKDLDDQKGIMTEVGTLLDKLTMQPERSARYKIYEEIYESVPLVKKMMKTWLANLIQKNPVTGKSLLIKDIEQENEECSMDTQDEDYQNKKAAARSFVDEVVEYFDLLTKLKYRILPAQQMYGDSLVEIINLNDFKLNDKRRDYGGQEELGGDYFLGESSIPSSLPSKSYFSSRLSDEEKLNNLLQKTQNLNNANLNEVCSDFADLFVDYSTDPNSIIMSESLANDQSRKDHFITLHESNSFKSADNMECFYDYVKNSAGEFKPYLKIKDNLQESTTVKKRGRPKKVIQEQKETFEQKLQKLGIHQKIDVSSILMLIHKPTNIVILESSYGTKLGYVEVADRENIQSTNITQQLSTIIGRIISVANNGTNSQEEILARIVRMVIQKIINQTKEKKKSLKDADADKVLNTLSPEVINTIKKLIIETDKDNPKRNTFRKLKARFIPLDRMFHFTVPSPDFYPYGQSFIDPLVLQGKLYILSQLSNIILKISRAAPVRKWIIDVGATQNQAKYVQQLKRDLYNQRVTIDNVLSFKSMPKILSDFKDIAVYRKNLFCLN